MLQMKLIASKWISIFSLTFFLLFLIAHIYNTYISDTYFSQYSHKTREKTQFNASVPNTMLLGVLGDILLHKEHQLLAFRARSFLPLWAPIQNIL